MGDWFDKLVRALKEKHKCWHWGKRGQGIHTTQRQCDRFKQRRARLAKKYCSPDNVPEDDWSCVCFQGVHSRCKGQVRTILAMGRSRSEACLCFCHGKNLKRKYKEGICPGCGQKEILTHTMCRVALSLGREECDKIIKRVSLRSTK